MKFINRIINNVKQFWERVKLYFTSKKDKQFAKEALKARELHKAKVSKNKSYFDRLPRKKGFKKAPSFSHMVNSRTNAILEKEHRRRLLEAREGKQKPKKQITKEQHEAREIAQAKQTFFVNLLKERARIIQEPFIKEKQAKKKARFAQKEAMLILDNDKFAKKRPPHVMAGKKGHRNKPKEVFHH